MTALDEVEIRDYGIMIGTCSLPSAPSQWKDFFEVEIQNNIFYRYKKGVYEYSFSSEGEDNDKVLKEFTESIFVPIPFYLVDSNKLLLISVVDDFEFAAKKHTISDYSNYYATEVLDDDEDFFTRSFSINTELGQRVNRNGLDINLVHHISQNKGFFPLFVVCRLKVDDALVIGCDRPLCQETEFIIREIIEANQWYRDQFDYLLIRSFGWHEFSILFFCTNYKVVRTIVDEVVGYRMKSLMTRNETLYKQIVSTSLMSEWISKESASTNGVLLADLPIFSYARTQFGFPLEVLNYVLHGDATLPLKYMSPSDEFKELLGKKSQSEPPGQTYQSNSKIVEINNEILPFLDLYFKTKLVKIKDWIKKSFGIPNLLIMKTWRNNEEQKLLYFKNIERYVFTETDLYEIRNTCRKLKVNANDVLGMFTMYNQYVRSPMFYRSFIRLRSFLDNVRTGLKHYQESRKANVQEIKNQLASWNLTFQKILRSLTHRMTSPQAVSSISNLDCWQLLKLLDSNVKVQANNIFLPFEEGPVLVLDNVDEVFFSGWSMQVGIRSLLQPSLFLSVATHVMTADFLLRTEGLSGRFKEFHQQTDRLLGQADEIPFLATDGEIDAILGALINYYVTFNKDSELFLFWYWHKFMQQPNAYHQNGEIEENIFVSYLLRMMVLIEFIDHEADYFKSKIIAPFPELQNLWFRWFIHIRRRVDELLVKSPVQILKNWFDQAKALVINEVIPKLYTGVLEHGLEEEADIVAAYRQIRERRAQPLSPASDSSIKEQIARDWYEDLLHVSSLIMSKLERGEVFKPFTDEHYSSNLYLHAASLAYLQLIRNTFKGQHSILYRLGASSTPSAVFDHQFSKPKRLYSPLVFDSRGGIFTTSLSIRREFFKVRVAYFETVSWMLYEQELKLFSNS